MHVLIVVAQCSKAYIALMVTCSSVVRALAVEARGQISFVLASHPEWSNVVEHLVPSLCCYEVNENLQSLEIKLRPLALSCQCPHISL